MFQLHQFPFHFDASMRVVLISVIALQLALRELEPEWSGLARCASRDLPRFQLVEDNKQLLR